MRQQLRLECPENGQRLTSELIESFPGIAFAVAAPETFRFAQLLQVTAFWVRFQGVVVFSA